METDEEKVEKQRKKFSLRQWIKDLKLPQQFCGVCTLKEGTIIVLSITQMTSFLFTLVLALLYFVHPERTEHWWKEKFEEDFDPYKSDDNKELIARLVVLWRPFFVAMMAAEGGYMFVGLFIIYALLIKDASPYWYIPWLFYTFVLVTTMFLIDLTMFVCIFIFYQFRELTVTWDLVPIICVSIYAGLWTYGFCVVYAQYKRRVIVAYWKENKTMLENSGY